ncbi:MAG: hypothetical protein CVT94_06580 [Bacteroidetes bacterium HGW-Bacteroidetes-11]|nr:MAG: hypothetical protein CVT94_06580 [Bacteroidetes bacterium HGW-Bacteroidetes-11]
MLFIDSDKLLNDRREYQETHCQIIKLLKRPKGVSGSPFSNCQIVKTTEGSIRKPIFKLSNYQIIKLAGFLPHLKF